MTLKIAAKVDRADRDYFDDAIEPLLDRPVDRLHRRDRRRPTKSEFLGNAAALLFPIDWPEPFGLVTIEAMACGTPVIAWNCGSLPEIVDHGVTGFIVDSKRSAGRVAALSPQIDRRICAGRFRAAFRRAVRWPATTCGLVRAPDRSANGRGVPSVLTVDE